MWWMLYGYYLMFMCAGQNTTWSHVPNFHKLPCVEHSTTKLDWKSTMYCVVKYP